jgi:hypothetical protein
MGGTVEMEEILSGCALFVVVRRKQWEAVAGEARSSLRGFLILASAFASPNCQELLLLCLFHFDDFCFSIFLFFVF